MNTPYVPTFEPQAYIQSGPYRNMLNMKYFATEQTALEMMERFGAERIEERPYPALMGNDGTDAAPQRILAWADGLKMNAGVMADYFIRNPEDQFPGLAEKFIWQAIASQRAFMASMQGTGDGQ